MDFKLFTIGLSSYDNLQNHVQKEERNEPRGHNMSSPLRNIDTPFKLVSYSCRLALGNIGTRICT